MLIMSTYSGIAACEGQKEEYQMTKVKLYTFQCAEPFSRHHFYRGTVYNHNNMRHYGRGGGQVRL